MIIAPGLEGGPVDGGIVEPTPETFWAKIGRFFKGLLGLDSGLEQPTIQPGEEIIPDKGIPVPVIPKG